VKIGVKALGVVPPKPPPSQPNLKKIFIEYILAKFENIPHRFSGPHTNMPFDKYYIPLQVGLEIDKEQHSDEDREVENIRTWREFDEYDPSTSCEFYDVEIAIEQDRLILTGDPDSGKTTILKNIAYT
jgi:hypothetical protein